MGRLFRPAILLDDRSDAEDQVAVHGVLDRERVPRIIIN